MAGRQDPTPVPGAEAYTRRDSDARLSQAAIVLSLGAAAAGVPERVDRPTDIGLPADLSPLGRPEPVPLAEAVAPLGITVEEQRDRRGPAVAANTRAALMDLLVTDPNPVIAATLVEACMRSDDRLVRTAAAVAAIDTTGPRNDVLAQLVDGASRGRGITQDIGRIGLSRLDPRHPVLRRVVGRPSPLDGSDRPSHTAFLTHGTFAALTTWWQPGGDFYTYLDGLAPPLHLHDPSFKWSGLYSDGARRLAAQQMLDWVTAPGPAAAGPVRPQPRRHGGEPGHRARTAARPARPAELAGPPGVVPGLRQGAADHRHPGPAGPGDPRRPRRADLHPACRPPRAR